MTIIVLRSIIKKVGLIIIFNLASNHFKAQTTWSTLHSVNGYSSNAMHIQDDSLLYIVGDNPSSVNFGTGYYSSNHGNNWSQFTFDTNVGWGREVYFSHPDTGYFVSQNFGVIKTTNGGSNWTNIRSNTSNVCAEFLNGKVFYLGKSNGDIEKTIDGGQNWVIQNTPISFSINSIYFVDSNLGYATAESGVILKTTNGGNNWIQIPSGVTFNLDEINFPTTDTGFVLQRNSISNNGTQILKTVNGGTSWFTQISNSTNFLNNIEMLDGTNGYIIGENSTILKTLDGGLNWTPLITNLPSGKKLSDIFITNNTIYICGDGVFKSVLSTGIKNSVENNNEIEVIISPNPTINNIVVKTNLTIQQITIRSITGKLLKTITTELDIINVTDLSTGIYFLEITTDKKTIIKKFVKH